MKNQSYKAKILFIGPPKSGKTKLTNFLADQILQIPDDFDIIEPLRIVEYDLYDIQIDGNLSNVDVQIWDASGDDKFVPYWAVFRKNIDGIVFVYNEEDDIGAKKLDYMYNYFVSQPNRSLRTCLVCCVENEEKNVKLPQIFSKISQITINLEAPTDKIKQDFTKFIITVVNTVINK
ncbi:intraflagellar transport protein 22 homolog [Onthophagus taurus]|uniref:intraflagellar transport protein 22 homolog n=1 Tax=Onthophagus taurus TaxID=166361 RepID=UPI000C1FDBFE|nr:intraflagellar transport protein 22 homolog [Onthophagus taurus]